MKILLLLLGFLTNSASGDIFTKDYFEADTGSIFIVPLGVFSIELAVEGATGGTTDSAGFAAVGTLMVEPNDVLHIHVGDVTTSPCGGQASYVSDQYGQILILSAGGYIKSGSTFTFGDPLAGEGINGDCGGISSYAGALSAVVTIPSTGTGNIVLTWSADCDIAYDYLHSDYNPTLLSTSSLYLENSVALLKLDIGLPTYYYDVSFDFLGACGDVFPTMHTEVIGCYNYFYTSVEYTEHCNFTYVEDPEDPTIGLFSGTMRVNASVNVEIDSTWSVVRELSSPINWQVELAKLISVSSAIVVTNADTCSYDADCNSNGCCIEGQCDCSCLTEGRGYTGTYCEFDFEPPVCHDAPSLIEVNSPRGGCVAAITVFDGVLPTITDNSGVLVEYGRDTLNFTQGDSDDLMTKCFFPGVHEVIYFATDGTGNAISCPIQIVVVDSSLPVVDCARCQASNNLTGMDGHIDICIGTEVYASYRKVSIAMHELPAYMSLNASVGIHLPHLPGQLIDFTLDYGTGHLVGTDIAMYLDCECKFNTGVNSSNIAQVHGGHITNQWDSWTLPLAYDALDGVLVPSGTSDPEVDGLYEATYGTTDSSGLYAYCRIQVVYDITPPTCTSWFVVVSADPTNENFSLPVDFPAEPLNITGDFSGLASSVLSPARIQGDIYHVGYLESVNYTATWQLVDRAGNVGSCGWRVQVNNSDPCVWPACGDQPPINTYCPADITVVCSATDDTSCGGCVDWAEPTWYDDVGIEHVYRSHFPGEAFSLGSTDIFYRASDNADHFVDCNFTVTIVDVTPPVFTTCPGTVQISSGNVSAVEYTYSIEATDSCSLNDAVAYDTIAYPEALPAGSEGAQTDTVVLAVGDTDFIYVATDSSGNQEFCKWTVSVVDDWNPTIECPDDIVRRIADENSADLAVTFSAISFSDNVQVASVEYSPPSGTAFEAASTTMIVATVTDTAGLTATCMFNVTVEAAYPSARMDAVLTESAISELSVGVFGASLEIVTRVSPYNRLINAQSLSSAALTDPVEGVADCDLDQTNCFQTWRVVVAFASCVLVEEPFDFTFESECLPEDCILSNAIFFVQVTLTADNYCWQDLSSVAVFADLTMHTIGVHNAYMSEYDRDGEPVAGGGDYPSANAFYNEQYVAGIIEVTSTQALTSLVEIRSAEKQLYSDPNFSDIVSTSSLVANEVPALDVSTSARESVASFYYWENGIPPNSTYHVRYTATVEITYDLGLRRRLLSFDFDSTGRQLLESASNGLVDKEAKATAILLDSPVTDLNGSRRDAVVLAAITQCFTEQNLTVVIGDIVAEYLMLARSRVEISMRAPDAGVCLVQIRLVYSDCDNVIKMSELLTVLETGITSMVGPLHDTVSRDDSMPPGSYFLRDLFYVVQSPQREIFSFGFDDTDEVAEIVPKASLTDTQSQVVFAVILLILGCASVPAYLFIHGRWFGTAVYDVQAAEQQSTQAQTTSKYLQTRRSNHSRASISNRSDADQVARALRSASASAGSKKHSRRSHDELIDIGDIQVHAHMPERKHIKRRSRARLPQRPAEHVVEADVAAAVAHSRAAAAGMKPRASTMTNLSSLLRTVKIRFTPQTANRTLS